MANRPADFVTLLLCLGEREGDGTGAVAAQRIVGAIASVAHDPEVAHGMEDDFRDACLRLAAAGHPNAQAVCAVAIETSALDFERWTA